MELAAFICSHVFERRSPVLYVCREGGDWQFLCGAEHAEGELPRVVGINHLFEGDPSLLPLRDLPSDWEAERSSPAAPWIRRTTAAGSAPE